MSDMRMYNILGVFKGLTKNTQEATPLNESVQQTVYEPVEPRGSIMQAVQSLENKFKTFKESKKAKPDFLDVDKDGDKAEPFKKAVKDKEAVNEVFSDKEAKAQRDATKDRAWKAKGEANTKKYEKNKKAAEKRAQERAAKKNVAEGAFDYEDDNVDYSEFHKAQPENPDTDAVAKRKRLQAIKDRQEDERAERGENKPESNVKIHKGTYGNEYKGDADLDEGTIAKPKKDLKKHSATAKRMATQKKADKDHESWLDNLEKTDPDHPSLKYRKQSQVAEVAPPGAKAERMVKHIKKGYAKDGNLSKKEKGIAYATAWKAKKEGNLEEGTEFKDAGKIKNSAPNMKKAKPAMVKESRVMEETDYFYEKVGKALADANPHLDTAGGEFVDAVRKEMVAQGIQPNRARNILMMDEDFLSDVATSYDHYCKDVSECGAPINSFVGGTEELDEIAKLAGLPVRETDAVYDQVNHEEPQNTMDETALGAVAGGVAGAALGKTPAAASMGAQIGNELAETTINGQEVNVNSIEVDGVNDWDSPDFADAYITYAEFSDGTPLSDDELVQLEQEHGDLVNQAAHNSLQGRADFLDENDMAEGNEFSGALAKAKAAGAKEFEVDGKKYTVKEDVNINISANGDEDVLALVKKLAGLPGELVPSNIDEPMVDTGHSQVPLRAIPTLELPQDIEEERDVEYTNTPNEKIAPLSAAIPNGADLNRSKKQYKKEYPGDNPMAVKEAALWKSYENMINDIKD